MMPGGEYPSQQAKIDATPGSQLVSMPTQVHTNLHQEMIIVTEDKLRLWLGEYEEGITAKQKWAIPLGIFLTVFVALLTSDFKNFLLTAGEWEGIFILLAAIMVLLSIVYGMRAFRSEKKEDAIERLKRGSVVSGTMPIVLPPLTMPTKPGRLKNLQQNPGSPSGGSTSSNS